MTSDDNGGPAFPVAQYAGGIYPCGWEEGMTLRHYLAAHAPISLSEANGRKPLTATEWERAIEILAELRVRYADAMIEALAK